MGRGILELTRHSPVGVAEPSSFLISFPFEFPGFALNRFSVRAFNALYFRRVPEGGESARSTSIDSCFHWM